VGVGNAHIDQTLLISLGNNMYSAGDKGLVFRLWFITSNSMVGRFNNRILLLTVFGKSGGRPTSGMSKL
jgi:hypothetical protein